MRIRPIIAILMVPILLCGCGVLDKFGGPSAKKLVSQAFESPDPDVRRNAINKLSSRDWGRKDPYTKGYATMLTQEMKVVGPKRSVMLICSLVRALGRCADPTHVAPVITAMSYRDEEVRTDAAVALGDIVCDKSIDPLRRVAKADNSVRVRTAVCKSLAQYRRQEVVDTLVNCLSDEEFAVQYQAHAILVKFVGEDRGMDRYKWSGIKLAEVDAKRKDSKKTAWNFFGLRK